MFAIIFLIFLLFEYIYVFPVIYFLHFLLGGGMGGGEAKVTENDGSVIKKSVFGVRQRSHCSPLLASGNDLRPGSSDAPFHTRWGPG